MPLIINNSGESRPNPQAVMLGKQHLRKVMLGGDVVWQKHRPKPPSLQDLTLETLEYQKVKLKATNHDGQLFFPMFFPPYLRDDWQAYRDKLTFIGDAVLSLQSICGLLEADVIDNDMQFPMFFFDGKPPQNFDYRRKCTFIANIPAELALESIDAMLVAEVENNRNLYFPMVFPVNKPTSRFEFLDRLTFIDKDGFGADLLKEFNINVYDSAKDVIKDFTVNAYSLTKDCVRDFPVNAYDPAKDSIADFEVVVWCARDFDINVYDPEKDFIGDFDLNVYNPGIDAFRDFNINAYEPEKDFIADFELEVSYTQDFLINVHDSAKDVTADFPVNIYDPVADVMRDFEVNATDTKKDFIRDFSINAFDSKKDTIGDFILNVSDPTKNFVKDFTVPVIKTADFIKNFTFPAIKTVDFTKDFTVPAIRIVDFTKNFTLQTIITKDFTKTFSASITSATSTGRWQTVSYGNQTFAALESQGNKIVTSHDGKNWSLRTGPSHGYWSTSCFGNGLFVASSGADKSLRGANNWLITSPDGINWTNRTMSNDAMRVQASIFANNTFLLGGWTPSGTSFSVKHGVFRSTNGTHWVEYEVPQIPREKASISSFAYGNGLYVMSVNGRDSQPSAQILTSPDGINWTQRYKNDAHTSGVDWVLYGKEKFVAALSNGGGLTSTNGIDWTWASGIPSSGWRNTAIYSNQFGLYIFLYSNGEIKTSVDGVNWISRGNKLSGTSGWTCMCEGGGKLAAVAYYTINEPSATRIAYSTDIDHWTFAV